VAPGYCSEASNEQAKAGEHSTMVKKNPLQKSIEEVRQLRHSAEQVLENTRLLREELARQKQAYLRSLHHKGWRV
jgi:hypothetical protein